MEHQCACRPRRTKDCLLRSNVSGQLRFECFTFLRENVPAGIDGAQRGLAHLIVHKNFRERNFFHLTHARPPSRSIHFPARADSIAASTTRTASAPSAKVTPVSWR